MKFRFCLDSKLGYRKKLHTLFKSFQSSTWIFFVAYWIAHRACKHVFNDIDDLEKPPYPTTHVLPAMMEFFQVTGRAAMLSHFYRNFDKSKIAMFTKTLATVCEEKNDPLCLSIFEDAGRVLAKHLEAVSKKADDVSWTVQIKYERKWTRTSRMRIIFQHEFSTKYCFFCLLIVNDFLYRSWKKYQVV